MSDLARQVAAIKPICEYLSKLGVVGVVAVYEGSGDEGVTEDIYAIKEILESPLLTAYNAADDEVKTKELTALDVPKELDALTSHTYGTDLLKWLGDFLVFFAPDGYQDGNGGKGRVVLDVAAGRVDVEHDTYYIETSSDSYSYPE